MHSTFAMLLKCSVVFFSYIPLIVIIFIIFEYEMLVMYTEDVIITVVL